MWVRTRLRVGHLFDLRINLSHADLRSADLHTAHLHNANLSDADLSRANETCVHGGPSGIDHRTLQKSGPLPLAFLRGVGLPERLINSLPSLLGKDEYHSCFISYSTKDQEFADRLYADLQNKGVRCWLDKLDLRIGEKILDAINKAIKLRDKLLLILSKHSINSDWVEDEVTKAYAEERKRGQTVLFPICIDNEIMTTEEAWVEKLRDGRHIGDFRGWKDHGDYKQSFERVVRDLTIQPKAP
jgi:hypothetical protein